MTTTAAERIALTSPAALVASVPYLVGFTPEDSIVLVWLKDTRVQLTMRVDMDAITQPAEVYAIVTKHGFDEVIVLFYGDFDPLAATGFHAHLQANVKVRDVLAVTNTRWKSLLCEDPECCPPEGTPIDPSLVAAEFVGVGVAPLTSREQVAATFQPQGTRKMRPLPVPSPRWRTSEIKRVMNHLTGSDPYDEGDLVKVGRALHDIRVRDVVLWELANDSDLDMWIMVDALSEVCRAMRPEDSAPALSVTGLAAYLTGDGTRASIAADKALEADPTYSLAQLLQATVERGVPPTAWRETMKSLTRDTCLKG